MKRMFLMFLSAFILVNPIVSYAGYGSAVFNSAKEEKAYNLANYNQMLLEKCENSYKGIWETQAVVPELILVKSKIKKNKKETVVTVTFSRSDTKNYLTDHECFFDGDYLHGFTDRSYKK